MGVVPGQVAIVDQRVAATDVPAATSRATAPRPDPVLVRQRVGQTIGQRGAVMLDVSVNRVNGRRVDLRVTATLGRPIPSPVMPNQQVGQRVARLAMADVHQVNSRVTVDLMVAARQVAVRLGLLAVVVPAPRDREWGAQMPVFREQAVVVPKLVNVGFAPNRPLMPSAVPLRCARPAALAARKSPRIRSARRSSHARRKSGSTKVLFGMLPKGP